MYMLYMCVYTYMYIICGHICYICIHLCVYVYTLYVHTYIHITYYTHKHIKSKGWLLSQMKNSRLCRPKHATLS